MSEGRNERTRFKRNSERRRKTGGKEDGEIGVFQRKTRRRRKAETEGKYLWGIIIACYQECYLTPARIC